MCSMTTQKLTKINQLIRQWPKGVVGTQRWLDIQGVNRFLAQHYCYSGWIERLGHGAYKLADDEVDWTGGVYALLSQLKFNVHVGCQTALELQHYRQFVAQRKGQTIWLLKSPAEKRKLPQWFFEGFVKQQNVRCVTLSLFDDDQLGLTRFNINDYELIISAPERAVLEYLSQVPKHFSFEQAQFLIEGMMTLRPDLLQTLLEHCSSFKTKRLFLVLSEQEGHHWWRELNLAKLDLGDSKLTLGKAGGHYYSRYKLSLPIKLGTHEGYSEDD